MSDDNSSRLLASFIQTTSDFRVLVNDGFKQLDRTLNRLEEDVATRLSKIEGDIQSLNDKLSTVDKQFQERLTTGNYDSTPLPEFPRMVLKDNPFADENIPRNVMPPPLPKGQSLQFRWEHFDYLCKEVLEALKKPYQDRYFATFKRNGIMYAQGCVLNMKAHHHLDPAVTWDNLTKALKHEAKDLCEKVVGQEFPLVACVEGWGARLLMRKAFLNCKEDESAGTAQPENSDQEIPDNIGLADELERDYELMDRSDELLAEHFESGFQSDDVFPSSPTIDATQKRPILDTMFSSESEDSETEEPVLQPLNAKVTRTYGTKQGQKGTGTGASSSSDTTNQIKKEEAQLKVEKYWAPRTHTTRQAPLQRNGAGLRKVQWTKATQRTILQKRLVDRVRHLLITRKRIIRALPLILPWTPMSIRKSASWHSRKSDE